MAGLSAIAANVPRYRRPREIIARAWGGASTGDERAVGNHDEDALTLAEVVAVRSVQDEALELTGFHNHFRTARPA